jgi:hypothetical protein
MSAEFNSRNAKTSLTAVIPAKAGIQSAGQLTNLDSRFRGNDKILEGLEMQQSDIMSEREWA